MPMPIRALPPSGSVAEIDLDNGPSLAEVQLREYWRIILKYRRILAAIIAACTLLATIYAFTLTPRYTGRARIRISTYEPVLTATKIEDMLQQKSKETSYLETQIQEIKSFSLADQVMSDPLVEDAWQRSETRGWLKNIFGDSGSENVAEPLHGVTSNDGGSGYKHTVKQLTRYLKTIDVEPVRRTSLVEILATYTNPETAALIANKHALSYIDWVRTGRVEQQSRGLEFLHRQADDLKRKVADLDQQLAEYAEANSIVAVNKDENVTAQKLSQLNKLATDAAARRIEAENIYREAENSLSADGAGYEDSSTQAMRSELSKLTSEYAQLSMKFTPSYPRMKQLSEQIAQIKSSIVNQRKQIVVGLKSKFLAAQAEEKKLAEEMEQQKSQAFELSKSQVQYNVMQRELTTSREMLESVLKQIKETTLAVESNASNVSVVDYAVVPREPSFPDKRMVIFVGLLIGFAGALGVVFLLNYLDNTLRTPEDLQYYIKVPSLGVVPSFKLEPHLLPAPQSKSDRGDLGSSLPVSMGDRDANAPVQFLRDPQSLAAEAYRTIRTGILLSQAGEPPRTLLITSAQSSEGKTTSAVNLAASLASAGARVMVVDADLRRPSVAKQLNIDSRLPGLVEMLTGQCSYREVALKDAVPGISVIPSGKIPPNPAELLGSPQMASIIDNLAERYDYVIIDSPPILPVTDSVILSRFVDGVVMVVRGSATPRRVVADARQRLRAVGARMLGIILNDVDVSAGDYYYYNRYYQAYHQEDTKPKGIRAAS